MFISAMPAFPRLRAQFEVLTNSGNSERNGATHWMNTNWEIPSTAASPIMLSRKGCTVR